MTDFDLHALANLPFAGQAAATLRAQGLMLPDMPEDHALFRVEVEVTITRTGRFTMLVSAPDEQTAIEVARDDGINHVGPWDEDVEADLLNCQQLSDSDAAALSPHERRTLSVA